MNTIKKTVFGVVSLFMMNAMIGCGSDAKQTATPPANDTAKHAAVHDPDLIKQDGDKKTYQLNSFKLDSARGLVIVNGHDIYQVDDQSNPTSGYWMQTTEGMDSKNQMHVTGIVVSKIADENSDGYITADDVAKYPDRWKDGKHTEYRLKGHSEFDARERTKLWRVGPVPMLK